MAITNLTMRTHIGFLVVAAFLAAFTFLWTTAVHAQLLGIDVNSDKVVSINQASGDITELATLPFDANYGVGFDYRPTDGVLYASVFDSNNNVFFYSVNPASGVATLSSKIMTVPSGRPPPFSIGFTASGDLYGYGERADTASGDFWFGDWNAGTFTLIPNGPRSYSVLGGDFDDARQVYWISDEWDGKVYQLNPSGQRVWSSSVIWPTELSGDLYDMDVTTSGEILVVGYSGAGGKILSVDAVTGAATEKFSLPAGSGVTRIATVPEPSTYALLLMTGAGALWLARRRR